MYTCWKPQYSRELQNSMFLFILEPFYFNILFFIKDIEIWLIRDSLFSIFPDTFSRTQVTFESIQIKE